MKIRKPTPVEWMIFAACAAAAIYTVIDILVSNYHQIPIQK